MSKKMKFQIKPKSVIVMSDEFRKSGNDHERALAEAHHLQKSLARIRRTMKQKDRILEEVRAWQ